MIFIFDHDHGENFAIYSIHHDLSAERTHWIMIKYGYYLKNQRREIVMDHLINVICIYYINIRNM